MTIRNPPATASVTPPERLFFLHRHNGRPARAERRYDTTFRADDAYRQTLPDMLEAEDAILGSPVGIQQVGISNFRLPMRYRTRGGRTVELETAVTGTVSLEATEKGINMSRIIRGFYRHRKTPVTPALLEKILRQYRHEIGAFDARIRLSFHYPTPARSLRSRLAGWQYYAVAHEASCDASGGFSHVVELDFVYSSACPCSAELAEHARTVRGAYAIAHSQRSKARIRVRPASGCEISVEDLREHCLDALKTETQVIVKREDEQAFAELNGAHLKFVEDAARLLHASLHRDPRIADFQIACAHLESLHSHDAVSVIRKGVPGGFAADFSDFRSLVC